MQSTCTLKSVDPSVYHWLISRYFKTVLCLYMFTKCHNHILRLLWMIQHNLHSEERNTFYDISKSLVRPGCSAQCSGYHMLNLSQDILKLPKLSVVFTKCHNHILRGLWIIQHNLHSEDPPISSLEDIHLRGDMTQVMDSIKSSGK